MQNSRRGSPTNSVGPPRTQANPNESLSQPNPSRVTVNDNDMHAHINDPSTYASPATPSSSSASVPKPSTSTKIFTPHDAILAELYGRTDLADSAHGPHPSVSDTPQSTSESGPPVQTIYDPSTGQRLGTFVPVQVAGEMPGGPAKADELWSQLSRILDLQSDIAGMHVTMEGIGSRSGRARSGSTVPDRPSGKSRARSARRRSGTDDDDDEDGDSDNDERGPGKRRREDEFAQLSARFTERKDAVGSIMNKLDDLSVALKSFHALPTPAIDLQTPSSRSNTVSSDTSAFSSSPVPPLSASASAPPRLLTGLAESQHMVESPQDMHPAQAFAFVDHVRKS
ncbi:hypothetical protein BJ138DRAFT_1139731 [Hygrophoropsis aurantiaca]|uniref:Uncharacterized protein n=1 Tax=Hygrophoropsis aurantiaca TaxID=72124 RepID=A0ACB8AS59_9AGAM|nr:hypothetical protein BJ138DRAFT_1139731 [Hygrophoropsis aurantiaca]